MEFKGAAKRLESIDISRLAHTIGCGEDHLHAVMEVETRGGGFDRHGRIKMLFEPHIFYRELSGAAREQAVASGLAYRRWGEQRYPRESYTRLHKAMLIDPKAALRSCSWGLGQIMGFNHLLAGYSTPEAMIEAFRDDEDTHLAAMVQFIVSNGLDDELRREDWRGFARGYNGAGYAKHGYHTKLKRAFDKWQRIPDTPFTPDHIDREELDPNPPAEPILNTRGMSLREGMKGPDVRNLQGILSGLGYPVGKIDGHFGRNTRGAVVRFQSDHDLIADGIVGELTWEALELAKPAPKREHTEQTLRAGGSQIIAQADQLEVRSKQGGTLLAGTSTLDVALAGAEKLQQAETMLGGLQDLLMDKWPVLVAIAAGVAIYRYGPRFAKGFRLNRVQDAVMGRHLGR